MEEKKTSKLKIFLDRRAEGLKREEAEKAGIEYVEKKKITKYEIDKNIGIRTYEEEVEEIEEENPNLTDEEFWDISNQYIKESRNSDRSQVEILQSILENYTPLKIKQFAQRYKDLNE